MEETEVDGEEKESIEERDEEERKEGKGGRQEELR